MDDRDEDRQDAEDLETAIRENAGKPLTDWETEWRIMREESAARGRILDEKIRQLVAQIDAWQPRKRSK